MWLSLRRWRWGLRVGEDNPINHDVTPYAAVDDLEVSLTADVIMRIEDVRESTAPTVLWSLPMVLVFGSAPAWWNAASIGFVLLGMATLIAIQVRTPGAAAMARHVVGVR